MIVRRMIMIIVIGIVMVIRMMSIRMMMTITIITLITTRVSITCACSMHLALFPLDEQKCDLDVASCEFHLFNSQCHHHRPSVEQKCLKVPMIVFQ